MLRQNETRQRVLQRPLPSFVLHEVYGSIACFIIFVFAHMLAYFIDMMVGRFPVHAAEPHAFMFESLAWIASIGTVVSFAAITVYQIWVLLRRLTGDL